MTEPVVTFALFVIGQHAISLGRFLELFLGGGVVRVFVRVILDCESPVGTLDLLVRRGAGDAQHFVIITLAHNSLFLYWS